MSMLASRCAGAAANAQLSIAFFKSVRDVDPGPTQSIAWEDLVQLLSVRERRESKDGPLFSLTAIRPGATRSAAAVIALSGAALDLDDVKDVSAVKARLAAYEHVLYTTHSHGEKGNRYRVVLPFARPVAPAEWPTTWKGLNTLVGGVLDPAARDVARISYLPSCPKTREHLAEFVHNRGAWIDPAELAHTSPTVSQTATDVVRLDAYRWSRRTNAAAAGGISIPPDESQGVGEGGRNEALTRLLGRWLRQGFSREEALAKARAWNSGNHPPLADDELVRTHASITRKHEASEASRPDPVQSSEAAPPETPVRRVGRGAVEAVRPLFELGSARVDRLISEDPPKRRWLLEDSLPIGKVGALIAAGGTGKSQFALQLAASVASGSPLADGAWTIGEPGGVLVLLAEDDEEEIHRRLRAISDELTRSAGTDIRETLSARLYVKSMVGENNLMTAAVSPAQREVALTDYPWRLVEVARQIRDLKLIVLDPASRFRGGIENSAEDVTRFIEALELVSKKTGATVLVAHHANKSSMNADEPSQAASRGSSAFTDGVRWQLNVATVSPQEAKKLDIPENDRRRYLAAHVTKNNYGPPQDPVYLRRAEGGYLRKASLVASTAKRGNELVLKVVAQVAEEPEPISAAELERRYGGVDGKFRVGKVKVRDAVSKAVAAGYLTKKSSKGQSLSLTALAQELIAVIDARQVDSVIDIDGPGHRAKKTDSSDGYAR